jgi:hypothetical protein
MNINFTNETLYPNSDRTKPKSSNKVIKEFLNIKEQVTLLYNLVYGFLSKNTNDIKSKKLTNKIMCDFGFICRELENTFDELRKEAKARKELCGNIIAYNITQDALMDPTIEMIVRGDLATASPDVKMQAALPKKFSYEYFVLTDYFKVPREVATTGILKLDWKEVTKFLTKCREDGKSIPDGFGKQYPLYSVTYRKSRNK